MAYDSFRPHRRQSRRARKKICRVLENVRIRIFFSLPCSEAGAYSPPPSVILCCTSLQARCTSLQNFAICETAGRPQSTPACLGCRLVCTTSGFTQKKDTNPVGGRGISAFFNIFFVKIFQIDIQLSRLTFPSTTKAEEFKNSF